MAINIHTIKTYYTKTEKGYNARETSEKITKSGVVVPDGFTCITFKNMDATPVFILGEMSLAQYESASFDHLPGCVIVTEYNIHN